jgi:hypothetical protein
MGGTLDADVDSVLMKEKLLGYGEERLHQPPLKGFEFFRLLASDSARNDEDGEKEYELNERESDEHHNLKLTDGFRLSSHALHRSVTDQAEANTHAECRNSDSKS